MLLDMTKKILDEACRVIGEENRDILEGIIENWRDEVLAGIHSSDFLDMIGVSDYSKVDDRYAKMIMFMLYKKDMLKGKSKNEQLMMKNIIIPCVASELGLVEDI